MCLVLIGLNDALVKSVRSVNIGYGSKAMLIYISNKYYNYIP